MNNSKTVKIRPVILSGDYGRKLWPVSFDHCPKQFARLINNDSLFLSTLKRVSDRSSYAAPIIIGNIEHIFFILADLTRLDITDAIVFLEPLGRNTATAALIAALSEHTEDMLHLVLPSDHNITDEKKFHDSIIGGMEAAVSGNIVLFGLKPETPDTGYGYIVPGHDIENTAAKRISIFTEKPNETFARILINQGALWNSGMFFYDPKVLCEEAKALAPEHYNKCQTAVDNAQHERKCILLRTDDYTCMESHSLDILIMEHTKSGAVLPCSIGGGGAGSWSSIMNMADKDKNNNAITGHVITKDVKNSYIRSEGIMVAAIGVEDCVIVATDTHMLVARNSQTQEINELLSIIDETNNKKLFNPAKKYVTRPWGKYKTIAEGKNFIIKQITIWPQCSISLQIHNHRAEHWVVISGTAKAECNGTERIIRANESMFIPQKAIHRLSNIGADDLNVIEVQSGDYLSESDITRLEDIYGRN